MPLEKVILVDELDREVGSAEKLRAHRDGAMHRAFSVFVFDSAGRLLLQKRAKGKYHSGGLWSNTCCGHPRPGETVASAAARRLREEMGFGCELRPAFEFVYRAELDGGLIEHEYDHVLVGRFNGEPRPEASEVEEWAWLGLEELRRELLTSPAGYSFWLRAAMRSGDWRKLDSMLRAA